MGQTCSLGVVKLVSISPGIAMIIGGCWFLWKHYCRYVIKQYAQIMNIINLIKQISIILVSIFNIHLFYNFGSSINKDLSTTGTFVILGLISIAAGTCEIVLVLKNLHYVIKIWCPLLYAEAKYKEQNRKVQRRINTRNQIAKVVSEII